MLLLYRITTDRVLRPTSRKRKLKDDPASMYREQALCLYWPTVRRTRILRQLPIKSLRNRIKPRIRIKNGD